NYCSGCYRVYTVLFVDDEHHLQHPLSFPFVNLFVQLSDTVCVEHCRRTSKKARKPNPFAIARPGKVASKGGRRERTCGKCFACTGRRTNANDYSNGNRRNYTTTRRERG